MQRNRGQDAVIAELNRQAYYVKLLKDDKRLLDWKINRPSNHFLTRVTILQWAYAHGKFREFLYSLDNGRREHGDLYGSNMEIMEDEYLWTRQMVERAERAFDGYLCNDNRPFYGYKTNSERHANRVVRGQPRRLTTYRMVLGHPHYANGRCMILDLLHQYCTMRCHACGMKHPVGRCYESFRKLSMNEREAQVKEWNACRVCLNMFHHDSQCLGYGCSRCSLKRSGHHVLLCKK